MYVLTYCLFHVFFIWVNQMFSALQKMVSKSRYRYEEDGFDLDLTYITPRLIAMSYPAENV